MRKKIPGPAVRGSGDWCKRIPPRDCTKKSLHQARRRRRSEAKPQAATSSVAVVGSGTTDPITAAALGLVDPFNTELIQLACEVTRVAYPICGTSVEPSKTKLPL